MKEQNLGFKKILLARTDGIGDLILTLPVIFALRKKMPDAYIALVINRNNYSIVKNLPYINEIIGIDNQPVSLLKALIKIRNNNFNVAIQLLPGSDNKGSFLIAMSNAKIKAGYNVGIFKKFYTDPISPPSPGYETDNVINILSNFIPNLEITERGLIIGLQAEAKITRLLKQHNIKKGEDFIIIHIGASKDNRNKIWPRENFSDLIDKIISNFKLKVFIIGSKGEINIVEKITKGKNNVFNLAGILTLEELLPLIRRCRFFISNNSGPLQIAVALGVNTISLIGPSLFSRWAPRGENHIVIKKELECLPCEGKKIRCRDNKCMKLITVGEVYQAVKTQLFREKSENYA